MAQTAISLVPLYHTFYEGVERVYCLNYANSNGELAATRFVYDKKGRNTMGFYQEISGNRSSKNFHTFDEAGRMVSKKRQYSDGETSEEIFTYDGKGRLIKESFSNSKGATGIASYEYDEDGNAFRIICEGYKGWLRGIIEFTFDQHGKRLEGSIKKDNAPHGTIQYQYGSGGSLIHEHWDLGKSWSQTLQYVYEGV